MTELRHFSNILKVALETIFCGKNVHHSRKGCLGSKKKKKKIQIELHVIKEKSMKCCKT